eukprot:9307029-Ditylum_brightwellii.AAC.1
MHQFMPRCCGKASFDEERIPCNGRAPCICVLRPKPIKRGWTFWCAADHAVGACFDAFVDDDSICAETANHLAWGMTGETVICIEREHKRVGIEDLQLYLHCHWAMDNWFTSKPTYDEMVWLGQYPYSIMEMKRYVPPFLKHEKAKKTRIAVPKGTVRA